MYLYFVVNLVIMGQKITFTATVEAHHNRIVIPKRKVKEIDIKPGDDLKVTIEKITAEE